MLNDARLKIATGGGLEAYEIAKGLFVSGQIGPDAVPLVAQKGIRSLICNRFDGEEPGQPAFMSIDWAASANGIRALHLPVPMPPSPIADSEAFDFAKALDVMPKPVLAYCGDGERTVVLWALSEARRRPYRELLLAATAAGFDLSAYVQRFQRVHEMRW
jgi:sulfide:quinone oxidoreductase